MYIKYDRAPIYTFVEQMALNSANIIATGGNKCYASILNIFPHIKQIKINFLSWVITAFIQRNSDLRTL